MPNNGSPNHQPQKRRYPIVLLLIILGSLGGCVALVQWLPFEPGCHVLDWQTRTWVTEENCLPSDDDPF